MALILLKLKYQSVVPEFSVFPAVNDKVGGAASHQEHVGYLGHHLTPKQEHVEHLGYFGHHLTPKQEHMEHLGYFGHHLNPQQKHVEHMGHHLTHKQEHVGIGIFGSSPQPSRGTRGTSHLNRNMYGTFGSSPHT